MTIHFFTLAKQYLRVTLALGVLLPSRAMSQQPPDIKIPPQKEKWIRVQSENFTINSNAGEKVTKLAGANLERLRKTLALMTNATAVNAPVPTSIFLFKDARAFKPYSLRVRDRIPSISGYFFSRPDGNYIAINAEEQASQIIYHEYIHFFVNNNLPNVPMWFNEGFAEYYSTFKSDDDKTTIGFPVAPHMAFLKSTRLMPLHQLLEKTEILHEGETKAGSFYAQSWLLVHYLMQGREQKLRPKLSQFLIRLEQGYPQKQAFREAFAMEEAQLQEELEDYLRQYLFTYTVINSNELAAVAPVRVAPLPYEEVLFHLGDLLAHQDRERLHEAEAHFNSAISVNSNYALGYAGLGFVEMNRGSITAARQYFEKAIALGQPLPAIYYHYGNCLLESIRSRIQVNLHDPDLKKIAREARSAFRAAIDLDREFIEAQAALGETFIFDLESPLEEGITALDLALKRLPSRLDIVLNLQTLCALNGDSAIAQILLNRVFPPRENSSLLARNWAQLTTMALGRAAQMLDLNKTREAIRILDRVQSVTKDALQLKQIEEMRQAIQHDQHVNLYKSAIRHAENKEFAEALNLLSQVISTCDDAKLQESAKQSLKQVQYNQQVEWYNQAVALLNKNQYNQAAQLLNRIVAAPADSRLAKPTQDLLARIRQRQKQN
jgi:tetratricopeptide (TPR) repeat protein